MQKSIRLLHERIGFALKWNWGIFISANLIFLLLFILMNILNLKNSSAIWKEFFLDRLAQVENIAADSDQDAPIPVVHTLIIDSDGIIQKAPTTNLQGMRLNASGFFGKIDHLQPGQNTIIFFRIWWKVFSACILSNAWQMNLSSSHLSPMTFSPFPSQAIQIYPW
jgi:hypothetical protein